MTKCGVYIVANDRVYDQAIALLSSLRSQDPDLPVIMIPFDENCAQVWPILRDNFRVQRFPDPDFLIQLTQDIADIFPRDFLKLPNKMRKLAVWFGPLEEFVYIDTDILLFQPLQNTLDYLQQADFFACDFQQKGQGLSEVFTPVVQEQQLFSEEQLHDVFNSGFWGSRKSLFTYGQMLDTLRECAAHREYFDFSTGTTDQPILNFLVLKTIDRRLNIAKANLDEPGSWAGSAHFEARERILYDGDRPLRYLHWAGCPLRPGGPYWELWRSYRFQTISEPLQNLQPVEPVKGWKRVWQKVKSFTCT